MSRLDTNAYYALGVPLYVVLAAVELTLARRLRSSRFGSYGFADTIGNLSAGLGEVIIGLFIGPLLIALYDFGYARIALFHWPQGPAWSVASWIAAFLLADCGYYVYHRAGHRYAGFYAIHGVHHQSERFNLTIALRHPWFSDFYTPIFYAPLPMLGIPPTQFFLAISLISFYALTIHSRMFDRPSLYIFVTPRTHILHHAKNPKYIGKNLGAMFTLWDRLFGTHVEPDPAEPPILGTPAGYQSHDGARAQWLFPAALLATMKQLPNWQDRLRLLIARPGYVPAGVKPPPRRTAPAEDSIPMSIRLYVAAQFLVTLGLALYILWLRDRHPFWLLVTGSGFTLWSLSTLGGLLDDRHRARAREGLRLIASAGLSGVLLLHDGYELFGALLLLLTAAGGLACSRLPESIAQGSGV